MSWRCFDTANSASNNSTANHSPFCPKVVLVGATGVGKTSILLRQNNQGFTSHISPTIGASFCYTNVHLNSHNLECCPIGVENLEMQMWDTAGQERFRSMAPMYYRNAMAAIAVYDITSETSFLEMKSWVAELRRNILKKIPLLILGNKSDLHTLRVVAESEVQHYADTIDACAFFETSALNGAGIHQAFASLAKRVLEEKRAVEELKSKAVNDMTDSVQLAQNATPKRRRCCS